MLRRFSLAIPGQVRGAAKVWAPIHDPDQRQSQLAECTFRPFPFPFDPFPAHRQQGGELVDWSCFKGTPLDVFQLSRPLFEAARTVEGYAISDECERISNLKI
jgi:hypothetical protein